MRPRLAIRRATPLLKRSPILRSFTQNSAVRQTIRPQIPFLSAPSTSQTVRYLTTERKQWIKYEVKLMIRYTLYIWIALSAVAVGGFALNQEWTERLYPTPHEWTWWTRSRLRSALYERDRKDVPVTDWGLVVQMLQHALSRLENPRIDGAGVKDRSVDASVGKGEAQGSPESERLAIKEWLNDQPFAGKDISDMPEAWRRGYYETLISLARAAENVEGYLLDKSQGTIFPPGTARGPSNPRPKPIPVGAKRPPREEDCEVAFPSPHLLYMKLLSTDGLNTRQIMDATLSYASWLEFKGDLDMADSLYQMAIAMSLERSPARKPNAKMSENAFAAATAYATFSARRGDLDNALGNFVTLLKERKSLPKPPSVLDAALTASSAKKPEGALDKLISGITGILQPLPYPPPPSDGTEPPVRDAKELCEEAALQLHIGEIIFASRKANREEGLAWTREGVDVAEEQLHQLGKGLGDRATRTTCRECLVSGMANWEKMVAKLVSDQEGQKDAAPPKSRWLGLWGEGEQGQRNLPSRWAAEAKVVEERKARARDLLEDLDSPTVGFSSILHA